MAQKFPEPLSGLVMPRFGEVATFMRLPIERDPRKLDIALVGVPWDGGTTNRPGARHGPREIRNQSSLTRRVHHVTGVLVGAWFAVQVIFEFVAEFFYD